MGLFAETGRAVLIAYDAAVYAAHTQSPPNEAELSALEIEGADLRALYFERGSTEFPLTKTVRAAAERNRQRMMAENA